MIRDYFRLSRSLIRVALLSILLNVAGLMSAKLYFRYGVVNSAKTLNLLAVAHSYQQQGKSVLLLKPELDIRFGADIIQSKAGLQQKADVLIKNTTNLLDITPNQRSVDCMLVDEVQFLDPVHIDQLRHIVSVWNIPVIAYGLRTDFRTNFFPGSLRLMELADNIEENWYVISSPPYSRDSNILEFYFVCQYGKSGIEHVQKE